MMQLNTIGDLARNLGPRNRSLDLKQTIDRLTHEMTTGRVDDPVRHLGGDLRRLAEIEHRLTKMESYRLAISEAAGMASAAQSNIDEIRSLATALGETLISVGQTSAPQSAGRIRNQAVESLSQIVSRLNGSSAGRSLFAGTATNRMPLADVQAILNAFTAAVSGQTSAAGLLNAADAWFEDPAGFRAAAYQGSPDNLPGTRVSEIETVAVGLRADDAVFRAIIRDVALNIVATDGSVALDPGETVEVFRATGARSFANVENLVGAQADLGYAEERLEQAQVRDAAERTTLQMMKNSMLEADPFETALGLENAQFQLEVLYAATVRTSELSLVGFLR